jgi:hypothetical protein
MTFQRGEQRRSTQKSGWRLTRMPLNTFACVLLMLLRQLESMLDRSNERADALEKTAGHAQARVKVGGGRDERDV